MLLGKLQRNTSSKDDDEHYASPPVLSSIPDNTIEEYANRKAPEKYQIPDPKKMMSTRIAN